MPDREQRAHVVAGEEPHEHVDERDDADDARYAAERVNRPIAEHREHDDDRDEREDADRIGDAEQLRERLPGEHGAACGEADVHQADQHERNHRAVDAELHAARDHLRQAELRPLRAVQCHHGCAQQLTEREADERPGHVAAQHDRERAGDDRRHLQVRAEP